MALSIGIDLGTTNSVAAVATPTGVEFTLDSRGQRIHPSVVSFPGHGGVLVGQAARDHRAVEPRYTVYSAKRLIGQNMQSPAVQLALTGLPYQVDRGDNQQPMIVIRDRRYTVPQISGEVLAYLRRAAQRQFGEDVTDAVVTVPANFTDAQRQATREAGRIAGLEVLRLINEPTAAALAYGYGRDIQAVVAVYDFGGGTFDISLLEVRGRLFEVLASDGELFLGGDDIDRALGEFLASQMHARLGLDPRPHPEVLTRLVLAAEEVKRHLSEHDEVEGTVEDIAVEGWDELVGFPFHVTRRQYEDLIAGYIDQTIEVCRRAVVAAGVDYKQIREVICVGGSTRIPLVRRRLAELFGRLPSVRINPDEVVAHGAAIQAGSLSGKLTGGTGMATRSPGRSGSQEREAQHGSGGAAGRSGRQEREARRRSGEVAGRSGRQEREARRRSGEVAGRSGRQEREARRRSGESGYSAARDSTRQSPADSDAFGRPAGTTARLGPLIASEVADEFGGLIGSGEDAFSPARPLLLDVTPATLSVATAGGYIDRILEKNAPIPIERSKSFSTARNNQQRVVIECCRGEAARFADNERLGSLVLDDIPLAARGEIEIEVTFRVDTDGILHVRASDTRTGQVQNARLEVLGAPVEGTVDERHLPSQQGVK